MIDIKAKHTKHEQSRHNLPHYLRLSGEAIPFLWKVAAYIRRWQGARIKKQVRQQVSRFFAWRKGKKHGAQTLSYHVCQRPIRENPKNSNFTKEMLISLHERHRS